MSSVKFPCIAKWFWFSDNGWVAMAKATNDRIEEEYHAILAKGKKLKAAEKRVKVDNDRFIDFSVTSEKEIKSHFNGVDNEENLVGIQRRFDDESKRRAIKRDCPQIFKKQKFCLIGFDQPTEEYLTEKITKAFGGDIHPRVIKSVTAVICNESAFDPTDKDVEKAFEYGIPVVKETFLVDSVSKETLLDTKAYELSKMAAKKTKAPAADDGSDNSSAAPPSTKKAKTAAPAPPPLAVPTKATHSPASWVQVAGSQWKGNCSYKKSGDVYAFNMTVLEVGSGGSIAGEIQWPAINNTRTKWKGTTKSDAIEFEEYEVIGGGDEVEVPVKYSGKIAGRQIAGKVHLKDLDDDVSFVLDLNSAPIRGAASADGKWNSSEWGGGILFDGDVLIGTSFSPIPVEMHIDTLTPTEISGRIVYTSLAVETHFSGTLNGSELTLNEDKLLKGEDGLVPLPAMYKAQVTADGTLKGNFGSSAAHLNGSFEMKL